MNLWNLNITFIEKFTVRQFQDINRLNDKFNSWEIDSTTLSNELFKLMILSINWETDKEKILNLVLDMESIEDYWKLNEEIAKRINDQVNSVKKKELEYEYSKLFKKMWGSINKEILAVEVMKYMWWSYEDYLNTPYDLIQAILVRMDLESKQK